MKALTRFHVAERALAEAKTIDAASEVCGWYDGMRKTAQKIKDRAAQIEATEFQFRAERKLGEMMQAARDAGALAKPGRKNRGKKTPITPTLDSAGVDKNLAKRARKAAKPNKKEFEQQIDAWRRDVERDDDGPVPNALPEISKQDSEARAAKVRANNISLPEWDEMHPDEQLTLLEPHLFRDDDDAAAAAQFNKQDSGGIEWAQWSWNPVTGCRHDCPYCYARDMAERYNEVYPHGFEPAFRPYMLSAPANTPVPAEAEHDTRFKNVFTCSMADLFGRWVPAKWIEAVLASVRDNPQWNFLFLTKFPKRMAEFAIPPNAWMGTTVDLQARVANAEAAFARLNADAGIRWLSIEPMLEPIVFERLDLFDWIVIGGASRSTKTPEFHPPLPWIINLYAQAKAAKCAVYMKTNLLGNRVLELPFDAPIEGDATAAPDIFQYLRKAEAA